MTAFLCIFFVPLIAVAIRHKKIHIEHRNLGEWLWEYGVVTLLIGFLSSLVTVYVFKNSGPVALNLDKYGDFAVHYMLLSLAIAIFLPYFESYLKQWRRSWLAVRFSFRKTGTKRQWKPWALLFLVLSMAALTLVRVNDNTFWGDEAFSILLARMNIPEMIQATARDVHPPLYYLILQGFRKLLGDHPYVFHLTSVIPVLLAYVFASTKLRRAFGYGAAGVFILLATLMPGPLTYNVEARMYSWAFLFVTLNFWYGYEILSKPTKSGWFLFSLNGLLAAYTHYYALISIALISLGVFAILIARSRKNLKPCLISGVAMVVGYSPWISTLLGTISHVTGDFWSTQIPSVRDCVDFLFGTAASGRWIMWIVLVPIAGFILTSLLHVSVKRRDGFLAIDSEWLPLKVLLPDSEFVWVMIGICAIAGTAAAGEAISYLFRPLFLARYLFPITGVLWLLPVVSVVRIPISAPYKRLITLILAVAILVLGLKGWNRQYQSDLKDDLKTSETTAYMSDHLDDSDCLVTDIGHFSWTVLHYYFPNHQIVRLSDADWTSLARNTVWLYLADTINEQETNEILRGGETIEYAREGSLATYPYHLYKITFHEG